MNNNLTQELDSLKQDINNLVQKSSAFNEEHEAKLKELNSCFDDIARRYETQINQKPNAKPSPVTSLCDGLPRVIMEYASLLRDLYGENHPPLQKIMEIMDIFFKFRMISEDVHKREES